MGGYRVSTLVTTNITVTTTTETIVATLSNITTPNPGAKVQLFADAILTTGTATTHTTWRWRRGSAITDTLIGEATAINIDTTAGGNEDHTHSVEDSPGEVAKQTYILTVQQTAATGDGTILNAEAWADINF